MTSTKPKREISETEKHREFRMSQKSHRRESRNTQIKNIEPSDEDIDIEDQLDSISLSEGASSSKAKTNAVKKKSRPSGGRESGTSSDEERWLDAIESGKLEEVDDEMKKMKDPRLMTARQRAMYERGNDKEPSPGGEVLMSLPTGYKEKVMTAEAIQKKQLKSLKRKQLADEKREQDKKRTMDRLLKKQESKFKKSGKSQKTKSLVPLISYRINATGATLSFPTDYEVPIVPMVAKEPPKVILCGVGLCKNPKRYNCSKTNVPLCSFECYKINLSSQETKVS